MTKRIFLLAVHLLIFGFFQSFSQKGFIPGYVVELNGDTTHGVIDYRGWDKNPKQLSFQRAVNTPEFVYKPGEIRAFSVAGEHYESAVVDVDVSPTKLHLISENSEPEFVRDTVFLQSLFRGEKNLLYLKDDWANDRFYLADDGYKPLIYKKFKRIAVSYGSTITQLAENLEYKKQLYFYLKDCPQMQKKIEGTRYLVTDLTELFSSYHECIQKPIKYNTDRKALEIKKGLLVGATHNSIPFEGDSYFFYILDSEYNTSVTPSVGIFLNARLVRSRRLTIANDIFYTSFRIEGKGLTSFGTKLENRFSYHYVKMHNLLQVALSPYGKVHLAAGPSTAILIKSENYLHVVNSQGTESDREFESRGTEFGIVGALGWDLGKVMVDLRYEKTTGISKYSTLDAKTSRFHLMIKYPLK